MTSATYLVTGTTCKHCVNVVTEELANLDGVTGVTVTLVPGGKSAVTVCMSAPSRLPRTRPTTTSSPGAASSSSHRVGSIRVGQVMLL
jgi:copper chaperone CopZ